MVLLLLCGTVRLLAGQDTGVAVGLLGAFALGTVVPLLGEREFGLQAYTAGLTFILVFGLSKAAANYFAGAWGDRYGRKPVLVAGWLVAVPVPLMLIWAPSWTWVIVANVLLGVSQGMTWSTTVVMKIDLGQPRALGARRLARAPHGSTSR